MLVLLTVHLHHVQLSVMMQVIHPHQLPSSVHQLKRRRRQFQLGNRNHLAVARQLLPVLVSSSSFSFEQTINLNLAAPEAPEADKTVPGAAPAGQLTANGNLVTPGCGKVLDKRNKMIKKSKIKIDPVSTFTNCEGNVCSVMCKPGRVFDKGSKGAVNGVIKVSQLILKQI